MHQIKATLEVKKTLLDRNQNELEWQIRRSVAFLWASSGIFIELLIHQIDECCWLRDSWPAWEDSAPQRS